jgi:short-subunit dehydrogenase
MSNNFVMVVGATGGLGREYSIQLIEKGYNILLVARDKSNLKTFKDSLLKKYKQKVLTYSCDITDNQEVINLFKFIEENNIKLSKLIHIAGIEIEDWFKDTSHDDILGLANTNVIGTTNIIHRALEVKGESLDILVMSSLAGFFPMPMKAVYSASKRYIIELARTLNYELKGESTHILAVCANGMPTRPDIVEKLKSQGAFGRLSIVNISKVVRISLKKLNKRTTIYVPGRFNRILLGFSKLIPRSLLVKILGRRWKKAWQKIEANKKVRKI